MRRSRRTVLAPTVQRGRRRTIVPEERSTNFEHLAGPGEASKWRYRRPSTQTTEASRGRRQLNEPVTKERHGRALVDGPHAHDTHLSDFGRRVGRTPGLFVLRRIHFLKRTKTRTSILTVRNHLNTPLPFHSLPIWCNAMVHRPPQWTTIDNSTCNLASRSTVGPTHRRDLSPPSAIPMDPQLITAPLRRTSHVPRPQRPVMSAVLPGRRFFLRCRHRLGK